MLYPCPSDGIHPALGNRWFGSIYKASHLPNSQGLFANTEVLGWPGVFTKGAHSVWTQTAQINAATFRTHQKKTSKKAHNSRCFALLRLIFFYEFTLINTSERSPLEDDNDRHLVLETFRRVRVGQRQSASASRCRCVDKDGR